MTVAELIKKLNGMDKSMSVVVQGYESGYDDVTDIRSISVRLNANEEEYLGRHEEVREGESGKAVILLASNRRQ